MPTPRPQVAPARRLILAAAVAAVVTVAQSADAQFRSPQRGDALDANPQLGSGGLNERVGGYGGYGGYGQYNSSFGNNVVTGNVTGGRAFRGDVGYGDPRAFRGRTAGDEFDRFNRNAAGVTTGGQLINNADPGAARPFFGSSTVAAPPAGFVRQPGSGDFVPPTRGGGAFDEAQIQDLRDRGQVVRDGDGRFGGTDVLGDSPLIRAFRGDASVSTRVDVNRSGELNASDPTLPVAGRGVSPEALVLGGRLTAGSADATLADVAGGRALSPFTRLGRDGRLDGFDGPRLRALGGELLRDAQGNPAGPDEFAALLEDPDARVDARAGNAQDARVDARAGGDGREALAEIERAARGAGELPAEDDPVLRLADPAEQSAQFRQLADRLDRFRADPFAEELRPRGLRRQREAAGEDDAEPLPGFEDLAPVPAPDAANAPDVGGLPPTPAPEGGQSEQPEAEPMVVAPADPPVAIERFSEGVTSPALKATLAEAEREMRAGNYVSAAARYEAAERLVPNQPLVRLGRATAELAAGYYRRAASVLRSAYGDNPELTMARVDAASLVGEERLRVVAEDLRRLSEADPDAADPLLLLAFVSYGQGRYDQAATFLDLAERRSGDDPFYAALKRMWALDARADDAVQDEPEPSEDAPSTRPGIREVMDDEPSK